jgi:hypothetical protein
VEGGPAARTRFQATIERREAPPTKRVVALIADLAAGRLDATDPPFDISRYRYRIRVRDRLVGKVVHEQVGKGDEAGARESFRHIEEDLDGMNVAEFSKEYNTTFGS